MPDNGVISPEFEMRIRVYHQDTDSGGVVFHGTYVNFFERARTEWLRTVGFNLGDVMSRFNAVFITREFTIRYHRPAFLDELVVATAAIQRFSRGSAFVEQKILRDGDVLSSGLVQMVTIDQDTRRIMPFPEEIRKALLETKLVGVGSWHPGMLRPLLSERDVTFSSVLNENVSERR